MRLTIRTLLLAGLLSSLAGVANAQTRLLVNCFWAPQHYVCQSVLPKWLEQVKEVTEGRVTGIIPRQKFRGLNSSQNTSPARWSP